MDLYCVVAVSVSLFDPPPFKIVLSTQKCLQRYEGSFVGGIGSSTNSMALASMSRQNTALGAWVSGCVLRGYWSVNLRPDLNKAKGFGFRVSGFGVRVSGFGFRFRDQGSVLEREPAARLGQGERHVMLLEGSD
jgi:hypothetical protein